jgi:hypothetical protein
MAAWRTAHRVLPGWAGWPSWPAPGPARAGTGRGGTAAVWLCATMYKRGFRPDGAEQSVVTVITVSGAGVDSQTG